MILSPAAFGVYLIHVQKVVWQRFINGTFSILSELSVLGMVVSAMGYVIIIFSVCISLELVRIWMFHKLGIESLLQKIGYGFEKIAEKVVLRIEKLIDN